MRRPPDAPHTRSRSTWFERLLVAFAIGLLCGGVLTAIVASDRRERRQETPAALARTPPTDAARDLDGDGTADDRDGDPLDASSTTAPEQEALTPTCARRGITTRRGREGPCVDEEGVPVKVVNRRSALRLGEMGVRLLGLRLTKRLGSGDDVIRAGRGRTFVVIRLRVRNRLREPVAFYDRQFALRLGKRIHRQRTAAAALVPTSFVSELSPLEAGESRFGRVVFEVSRRRARLLDRDGHLVVAQFSEPGDLTDPYRRLGLIRTYR